MTDIALPVQQVHVADLRHILHWVLSCPCWEESSVDCGGHWLGACTRCASNGEEQAALYNMACAYAALRQQDSALACLEGAFEAGLTDYATVRSDPDLSAIPRPELEKLLGKYDGFLARLQRKKDDGGFWLGW